MAAPKVETVFNVEPAVTAAVVQVSATPAPPTVFSDVSAAQAEALESAAVVQVMAPVDPTMAVHALQVVSAYIPALQVAALESVAEAHVTVSAFVTVVHLVQVFFIDQDPAPHVLVQVVT